MRNVFNIEIEIQSMLFPNKTLPFVFMKDERKLNALLRPRFMNRLLQHYLQKSFFQGQVIS